MSEILDQETVFDGDDTSTADDKFDIEALAQSCLDSAGGDLAKALALLMAAGTDDDVIYLAITKPLFRLACYDLLRKLIRQRRDIIWSAPNYGSNEQNMRSRSAGESLLLDFPLLGGKPLRDGMKEDVATCSQFYRAQSDDMNHKALWLALIAKHLPRDKKVGDVFTEQRLRDLKGKAHAK